MKWPSFLPELVSLVIAVPLLLAGASKLLRPGPLAAALGKVYRWAGSRPVLAAGIARAVAVVELAAAFLVLTGWWRPGGSVLAGVVGLGIAGFAASALLLGRTAVCGCFGETDGKPLGAGNIVVGVALVAGAFLALQGSSARTSKEILLLLASTAALARVLFKHRHRLSGLFGRHFRSFSRLREGTDNG